MRQLPAQYIVFIGVMDVFPTALLYLVSSAVVILLIEKKEKILCSLTQMERELLNLISLGSMRWMHAL